MSGPYDSGLLTGHEEQPNTPCIQHGHLQFCGYLESCSSAMCRASLMAVHRLVCFVSSVPTDVLTERPDVEHCQDDSILVAARYVLST